MMQMLLETCIETIITCGAIVFLLLSKKQSKYLFIKPSWSLKTDWSYLMGYIYKTSKQQNWSNRKEESFCKSAN